ncbi:hypothetical protein GH714_018723 [Hevea brasiliensis]|uniref:Uncharacterized protein n=1 Tax=Hevea brasiliensis TaxID=3981 RepID=A0A6A6LV42_HEVBR|nr:hypothetical protein GH714_018723 [Hevea brasiliensis]
MTQVMDATSTTPKAPPISEMFQKFALAFKTKTFEFFADDTAADDPSDVDGLSLLDSAEDFIPDQKVIILKPDQPLYQNSVSSSTPSRIPQQLSHQSRINNSTDHTHITPLSAQSAQTLISSIFATVSSFEASYLQLQIAHVPFNEDSIKAADEALVAHLQSMSDFKQFYVDLCRNPDFGATLPIGSCLEAQVQENQSKLRVLGIVSDHLQAEIDRKDNEFSALRKKLGDIQKSNSKLAKRLSGNLNLPSSCDVLLSVRVLDSLINDACRATHKFTKILIDLMRKAGWDLDLAANSVHADIEYAKTGHNRYAFSHIFVWTHSSLKQLLEHVSSSPVELLHRNHNCEFSRFCEKKYQELVHTTMESSIFSNLDQNEVVLNSWRSLSIFYESFVNMASAVWTLHKLAFSFDPVVEIFQVERGVDFSVVYMEDVTRRCTLPAKSRMKVGYTVVPGFKIGRTIIQSQVYLCGLKCTE